MFTAAIGEKVRQNLLSHLHSARARTDELFAFVLPDARYERPIPERHRIVFYLGHVEAFDWNLIGRGVFGLTSPRKEFDRLFAFGIDPTNGNLPQDQAHDWPRELEIRQYNARVREGIDQCLSRAMDEQLFWVAIEHRLMHAETLACMLQNLPLSMKSIRQGPGEVDSTPVANRTVDIPSGTAALGMHRNSGSFGWDNEFDAHQVHVPAFSVDRYKVTNAGYLEFVRAGGYEEQALWSRPAWDWIRAAEIRHPRFWKPHGGGWVIRTMFADVPWQPYWPVYLSHAEADAFSRWKGKALPTEAQFHRAAFGTPDGSEREYPWGNEAPRPRYGNFDFNDWNPTRVDAHPEGISAFGVEGLVGNGWEWTSTPFAPFAGFKAFEFYPGYSADFFDGNHYVMKGGSMRTASTLLRRSFRNWFQPHFPNIYAGFRCVEN